MATKSTRSSGSQHNARGVTQGNTLVGPKSGLPIDEIVDGDGIRRLAVDANISASIGTVDVDLDYTTDSVTIGDPNTSTTLKINSNGSIDANVEVSAADGDNISISDGTNALVINPDGSINVNINPATTPTINNTTTVLANTEYSYAFPIDTKRFYLRARGQAKLQIAFTSGQTNINYITVFPGNKYEEINLDLASATIYFRSNKANEVVEILSWT